jgi:hypothetical protein
MIFLQLISLSVLVITIVFFYYSIRKMIEDRHQLYNLKENETDQDNLDLTNKQ